MKLEHFTSRRLSGHSYICDTEHPLIGRCCDMTVVVDGNWVHVRSDAYIGPCPAGVAQMKTVGWSFPDHSMAVLFALGLRGDEDSGELLHVAELLMAGTPQWGW
jgi:hypothetical protein